jgi:dTDP-glucose 4,6-dehydratase
MVSVHDCVSADLHAVQAGLPLGPFNLGSIDPPTVRDLLRDLIDSVQSRSRLLPLPSSVMKATLSLLDLVGLTILFPEQFMIADREYVLDLAPTSRDLNFTPAYNDHDMIISAFQEFVRLQQFEPTRQSA